MCTFDCSYLVWMFECPAIDAIIRSIETAFRKPGNISLLKATCSNGMEWPIPVQSLFRDLWCSTRSVLINTIFSGELLVKVTPLPTIHLILCQWSTYASRDRHLDEARHATWCDAAIPSQPLDGLECSKVEKTVYRLPS